MTISVDLVAENDVPSTSVLIACSNMQTSQPGLQPRGMGTPALHWHCIHSSRTGQAAKLAQQLLGLLTDLKPPSFPGSGTKC